MKIYTTCIQICADRLIGDAFQPPCPAVIAAQGGFFVETPCLFNPGFSPKINKEICIKHPSFSVQNL